MVNGQRFFLLCRERKPHEQTNERNSIFMNGNKWWLGLPESEWTKEKSQDAANRFWEERPDEKELDYMFPSDTRLATVKQMVEADPKFASQIRIVGAPQKNDPTRLDSLADTFLASRRIEVGVTVSAGGYDNLRRSLNCWKAFVGDKVLTDINAELLKAWHLHCVAMTLPPDFTKGETRKAKATSTVAEIFSAGRQFMNWLWENEKIDSLPRNFKKFKIEVEFKEEQPTFTLAEAKQLITEAPGQLKLHLMLFANCAFTQIDVATLTKDMVDLKAGTITRKRAKTKKEKTVPKVEYKLWPKTLELLKQYQSNHPVLFLTTESGKPWVRRTLDDDGVMSRTDAIVSNFRHVTKRLKIKSGGKSLKIFRKTSANLLEQHEVFAQVSQLFLGHALTSSVKKTNYVNPQQEILNRAIDWLGKQYAI